MTQARGSGSLRLRLLAATLVTLALALAGAYLWLNVLFRDHVLRQFDTGLTQHLDQLTARLAFDDQGRPRIDPRGLSDPRWDKPYSGLYWQIDRLRDDGQARSGVTRSRSLWDTQLDLQADPLADGLLHLHEAVGPQGHAVRVAERSIKVAEQPQARWRLMVAADTREVLAAVRHFESMLAASLAGLGALLTLAALAQVAVGLAPLRAMQRALLQVREGREPRLQGRFPHEVQPLIDDFNGVLDRNAQVLARARTQAGNLAHALKTPLAVLGNAAQQTPGPELGALVTEQVQVAQRHIHWHLARARVAATQHLPGQRTPLSPWVDSLLRVMAKVHADRHLAISAEALGEDLAFAGEAQDLQEMLGNLLDNACRHARQQVRVHAWREARWLRIAIDDDGPGIAAHQRDAVLQRGVRLDEATPGSGLGLAIVVELASLYEGALDLQASEAGGLRARLSLPAAA